MGCFPDELPAVGPTPRHLPGTHNLTLRQRYLLQQHIIFWTKITGFFFYIYEILPAKAELSFRKKMCITKKKVLHRFC
jgi:hypothetical protein